MLERFKQHADATGNRFFILAAHFLHAIGNRLRWCVEQQVPSHATYEPTQPHAPRHVSNGGNVKEAAQPFDNMIKRHYWDTVDLAEDDDPAALRHEMLTQTGNPPSAG
jgi:hypothetical protein